MSVSKVLRKSLIRPMSLIGLISLMGLIGLMGCGELSPEEQASLAAKGYYEHLMAGEYDAYMQGVSGTADMPDDYVEQLRWSAKQYVARLKQLHQGVEAVEVSNARADTTQHLMQVMLILRFTDGAREEICVPMVEHDGRWVIK